MSDVTRLLERWSEGDPEAVEELLAAVYSELRRLADGLLRHERSNHTLQPTALVHEAYLRFMSQTPVRLENRRHFYGTAAHAMRRVLVDYARRRKADKRGGPAAVRVPWEPVLNGQLDVRMDFEALDEALERLALVAPDKARVVELRYFGGMSVEETADVMGVSPATVKRYWTFARAWLFRALRDN